MKMMQNAFGENDKEEMPEDKAEEKGIVLVFSPKHAKKIMGYCDDNGIPFSEDME